MLGSIPDLPQFPPQPTNQQPSKIKMLPMLLRSCEVIQGNQQNSTCLSAGISDTYIEQPSKSLLLCPTEDVLTRNWSITLQIINSSLSMYSSRHVTFIDEARFCQVKECSDFFALLFKHLMVAFLHDSDSKNKIKS